MRGCLLLPQPQISQWAAEAADRLEDVLGRWMQ